jgi:glucose-6-phosphate 1-dehydrogenase
MLGESLEYTTDKQWHSFSEHIFYQQGLFDEKPGYDSLITRLADYDKKIGACLMRIFYLATPPDNYETILHHLQSTKLSEGCGQGSEQWTRVAIEKPFGKDIETAKNLDKKLSLIFEERQIFVSIII